MVTNITTFIKEPTMTSAVEVTREDHTLIVTLNRPEARNAVNGDITSGVEKAIDTLESDKTLWCAVLAGKGSAFCAGADLKELAAGNGASLSTKKGGFAGLVWRDRTKPLIAAVDGPALAGGTEIILSCDLVVASRLASFGLPEVKRSLVAAAGGLFRLPRSLPKAIALEALLTGEPISAETAFHHGMVNHLVEPGKALIGAIDLAKKICANAPLAVSETYQFVRHSVTPEDEHDLFSTSRDALDRLSNTKDYQEGPRAFIEKRDPKWSGT